ncbi:MAG: hypothetical protein ABID40_02155 [Candidatus Bipolaricaulota bacterium]
MKWYIPSWNGDFRLEGKPGDPKTTLLTVTDPTAAETVALEAFGAVADERKWLPDGCDRKGLLAAKDLALSAPLAEASAVLLDALEYPKRNGVVTAVRSAGDRIEVCETTSTEYPKWIARRVGKGTAAVTVKKPTLSCPECSGRTEKERKACDVLWAFLDRNQRKEWRAHRSVTVFGGRTGHCYVVSCRDTGAAGRAGRITADVDDGVILHHYDWTVPPEEEVLAAKILLEHREEWLRVEGEVDPRSRARNVFPGPDTIFSPEERMISGAIREMGRMLI